MNSSTLRRLASDHSSLHTSELPPNYLFPPTNASSSLPDDLTQLTILLTGPQGTPYSEGLWKLQFKIPEDYPKSPPKAAFRTRIWHPNVEENTGSVCVDTLKRDWDSKLTLRDILITISCLLIQPNPDSALNSTAGHLLQDDYASFARQARLMTSIHARIPMSLSEAVLAARRRGEGAEPTINNNSEQSSSKPDERCGSPTPTIAKRPRLTLPSNNISRNRLHPRAHTIQPIGHDDSSDTETEDEASASKENDPSQSPSPVAPQSPRKSTSIKRPLSDLPTPPESQFDEENPLGISPSERNIANNLAYFSPPLVSNTEPSRSALKLTERSRSFNFTSRGLQDAGKDGLAIVQYDAKAGEADRGPAAKRLCSREGKENATEGLNVENATTNTARSVLLNGNAGITKQVCVPSKKPALTSTAGSKGNRPRIGLRRL